MSGLRIKNLQSAKPLLEQHFNEMEFVVDLPDPDATLKLSGAELKAAVGVQQHTHTLEDVDGLPGKLDKKLNTAGGNITGDLRVQGSSRMKSLQVDEYLEVPELKYNRITATGNEFWVTDAGVVDDVWQDDDGIFLVTLRNTAQTIAMNFQHKDILRGIFHTETGFQTAYFEVTAIVDQTRFDCISLNDIPPQRFMTLARQGNKADPKRQGSIYLDGLNKWIRVVDGVMDQNITQRNIKVQLGDLSEISHPLFGQLEGYGALLENAYICGRLVQRNPTTGEDWVIGAVKVEGEQVFRYNSDGIPDKASILLTASENGISSSADNRKWQYKNGSAWVDIENGTLTTLTISHDNPIWGTRKILAVRYCVANLYFDVITLTKLYDGEDAYSVQLFSSCGNNFINGDLATILEAKVYKGSRDVTASIAANLFNWKRRSGNTDGDNVWNELHQGIGSQLTIVDNDVLRKAMFECEVIINQ